MGSKKRTILVVDAQGGGLGKQLVMGIRNEIQDAYILAVGTNSTATMAMLKAGADEVATGENSVVVACKHADFIIGPIGIVIADAMLGEITPLIAKTIAQSQAVRILIPFRTCDNFIVGVQDFSMASLIENAINELKNHLSSNE